MKQSKQTYDEVITTLANYVHDTKIESQEAYNTAGACLLDALGCAILALKFKECTKLLGPVVPGTIVPSGTRVPGTSFILDPIRGAFDIGTLIRWLDFNDTFLAAEWGHPSDNLGGLLGLGDYLSQTTHPKLTVHDLLTSLIKAYEIQGGLSILNSFNRVGFDHVILVKLATAAVCTKMMGGTKEQICDAISQVFIDTGSLRTYRHEPNTGSRKSWAAGDATSRGVMLAMMTMQGEMGYPNALTAPKWGLYDVLFKGKPFSFERPLGSYVMENILFKVSFPAEFHAQTAVEAAIQLHPQVKGKIEEIESIEVSTHESAVRIIDKKGPLKNPADRDHCMQYMVTIGLLHGALTAEDYEDEAAKDPRIDKIRAKIAIKENKQYTKDYLDPEKRSIASALTIHFKDGTKLGPKEVEFPLGHRRRRKEGLPLLFKKLEANLLTHFPKNHPCFELLKSLKGMNFTSPPFTSMTIRSFVEKFIP